MVVGSQRTPVSVLIHHACPVVAYLRRGDPAVHRSAVRGVVNAMPVPSVPDRTNIHKPSTQIHRKREKREANGDPRKPTPPAPPPPPPTYGHTTTAMHGIEYTPTYPSPLYYTFNDRALPCFLVFSCFNLVFSLFYQERSFRCVPACFGLVNSEQAGANVRACVPPVRCVMFRQPKGSIPHETA